MPGGIHLNDRPQIQILRERETPAAEWEKRDLPGQDAYSWWMKFFERPHVGSNIFKYERYWGDLPSEYDDLEIRSARIRFYFDQEPPEAEIANLIYEAIPLMRALNWHEERCKAWALKLQKLNIQEAIQEFNAAFGFFQTYPERIDRGFRIKSH